MLLIENAKIFGFKKLQGIFIANEYIKEINDSEVLKRKYKDSKRIDAQGKRVLPGFNDAHLHLLGYAKLKTNLCLDKAKSINEIIILGKKYLNENPKTTLLIASLYNDNNLLEKRLLTKDDLDLITKEIPIICYRVCGHVCSINSKAIEILNLSPGLKEVGYDIEIVDGKLNGILKDNAISLVSKLENDLSIAKYQELIIAGIKDANKYGITTLQVNDLTGDIETIKKILTAYNELATLGKLNARIIHQVTPETVEDLSIIYTLFKNSNYLKLGALKLFLDGSLGANTAYLSKNYINTNHNGMLYLDSLTFSKYIEAAKKINLPIYTHAIGDRAILYAISHLRNYNNRNAIIHAQVTTKEILEEFQKTKISTIVQPSFLHTDMHFVYDKLDQELISTSYAFKTLFNNTLTCFSSDSPVESLNPFLGIYHAVTRTDLEGRKIFNLHESMSVINAIKAYTENGAYLSFEENIKGKIQEGYLADLIIVDDDIYETKIENIKDIKVLYTITGGKIVYSYLDE